MKDDSEKSCDYKFEAADNLGLRLELTDLHAMYYANQELEDEVDTD